MYDEIDFLHADHTVYLITITSTAFLILDRHEILGFCKKLFSHEYSLALGSINGTVLKERKKDYICRCFLYRF